MTNRLSALLLVTVILALALPAIGKGAESATIDGPGIAEPIPFLDQSRSVDSYQLEAPVEMIRLTGLWYGPGNQAIKPPSSDPGPAYQVAWGMHGSPQPIIQYVYLDAPGGPVIHTPEQEGLHGWGEGVVGWFEAPVGLDDAIEEIVAWGGQTAQSPPWSLPVTASVLVAGLVFWGSRINAKP